MVNSTVVNVKLKRHDQPQCNAEVCLRCDPETAIFVTSKLAASSAKELQTVKKQARIAFVVDYHNYLSLAQSY